MTRTTLTYGLTLIAGLGLAACQQDIDIDLPPYEPKLVLNCYLEDGEPIRLTLLESRSTLDLASPPLVSGATVVIAHGGQRDTIPNVPFIDRATGTAYNYTSSKRIKADLDSPYTITVRDQQGRTLTATTRFIKAVPIKSITPEFNAKREAYNLTKFDDKAGERNFYRLTLTRKRVDTLALNVLIDDSFTDGKEITWGSGYTFKPGDTIHATLYHCTEEYFRFLRTVGSARGANRNPFAASGEVISNVQGGLGVFAALSYDYKTAIVPK
jgi:hypothetical protein